jgi:hypothetical protein
MDCTAIMRSERRARQFAVPSEDRRKHRITGLQVSVHDTAWTLTLAGLHPSAERRARRRYGDGKPRAAFVPGLQRRSSPRQAASQRPYKIDYYLGGPFSTGDPRLSAGADRNGKSRGAKSGAPAFDIERIIFRCFRMLDAAPACETAMFPPTIAFGSTVASSA